MPRLTQPKKPQTRRRVRRTNLSCYYCMHGITDVEYKNGPLLQKFMSSYSKILPTRKTGVCATHQRKLANAIKRARYMAIVPYVS